jgi:hypothetical protein
MFRKEKRRMSTREKREVAIMAMLAGGRGLGGVTSKTQYLALWGAWLNLSNVLSPMFPVFFVELGQTSSPFS